MAKQRTYEEIQARARKRQARFERDALDEIPRKLRKLVKRHGGAVVLTRDGALYMAWFGDGDPNRMIVQPWSDGSTGVEVTGP
jgi:hypothetical protein